jgi:CubicO group peptidase (beta-lactamase class C family)
MSFCELILHNSGLPLSLEGGLNWNPFAHMERWEPPRTTLDREQFFKKLNAVRLTAEPGNRYHYSNIGPALLGQLLAEAFDHSYGEILHQKVFEPMGLKNTSLSDERLLPGHNHKGKQVPPLHLDAQAPAAGLRSDAIDLSRLILRFLNPPDPDWEFWIASVRQDRIHVAFPTAPEGTLAGYGWFSSPLGPDNPRRVVWQYGGTAGHRAFVAFVPQTKTGLVLLTNQTHDLKELGLGLIRDMQSSSRP